MSSISDWLQPAVIWFVVGLILLLLEFAAPGVFVLFFGLGAWLVGIICYFFNIGLNLQLVLFLVLSIILLAVLRRKIKTMLEKKLDAPSDLEEQDAYVGQKVKVIAGIDPDVPGKVELHGTPWMAEADVPILEGAMVVIVEKKNITLKVRPLY
ncbi:MAG: NfeD family protein [Pseudomonadota bacterium]